MLICGRIILRIITEYIAYYHIAELYVHASIVSTYMWGLKDVSTILSKTLKSQLCGSLLLFVLQLACNAFHGALTRWTRNWHHYFCHSLHHICCDGGGPLCLWGPLWPAFPYVVDQCNMGTAYPPNSQSPLPSTLGACRVGQMMMQLVVKVCHPDCALL